MCMTRSWGRAAVSQETICIIKSRTPGKVWWAWQSADTSLWYPPQNLCLKTRSTLKPIRETRFWGFSTAISRKCVETRWWSSFAGMWGWKWGSDNVFSAVGMDLIAQGKHQVGAGQGSKGGSELVSNWCETGLNLPGMGHNQHSFLSG